MIELLNAAGDAESIDVDLVADTVPFVPHPTPE